MRRIAWLGCVLVCLVGCSKTEEAPSASDVVEVMPSDDAAQDPSSDSEPEVSNVGEVVPDAQPSEDAPAPRDLSSELRAAIGNPIDCVKDYRPSSAKTIVAGVSAIVRPSGLIIEPSVSGTGLSNNDRKCIADRVGQIVLQPVQGGTSEPVSTTISMPYEPEEPEVIKEYDVGGPAPDLKDVVDPLPKKQPIAPSGVPVDGPKGDAIDGPKGDPIEGPKGVPVEGPKPKAIDGYEVDQEAERWTDD